MDFTTLTGAVNLTTVGTAILAIAALKVVPIALQYGVRVIMGMIKR